MNSPGITGTRATVAPSTVPRAGAGGTVGGRYQDGIQQPTGSFPQERIAARTQIVNVPVPQIFEYIHQERISDRAAHARTPDVITRLVQALDDLFVCLKKSFHLWSCLC